MQKQLSEAMQMGRLETLEMLKSSKEGRQRGWDEGDRYKNCRVYTGKSAEWDEWSERLLGIVKGKSPEVHAVMQLVEHQLCEKDLEMPDYAEGISRIEGMPVAAEVANMSAKLHRLLAELATLEANAVVRRSIGENGLLAWRRLTTNANPKTLASGMKAMSIVNHPNRITDLKQMDICLEEWEGRL